MADLVIREEDGWLEISDVVDELGPIPKQELWEFAGQGNAEGAEELLDMELGDAIEEKIGMSRITGIKTVSIPDDIRGEHLRVWIQYEKIEEAPPPAEETGSIDIERELDMARNIFGKLRHSERERLRAVLYHPNEDTWSDAYSLIIGADRRTTLWQSVIAVDPTFPQTGPVKDDRGNIVEGWKEIPSQETLVQALRYATH